MGYLVIMDLAEFICQMRPEQCVIHSFRHRLRDRLRAVECPAYIIDCIGGWERRGVGENYGDGYPLEVLNKWMLKIT